MARGDAALAAATSLPSQGSTLLSAAVAHPGVPLRARAVARQGAVASEAKGGSKAGGTLPLRGTAAARHSRGAAPRHGGRAERAPWALRACRLDP